MKRQRAKERRANATIMAALAERLHEATKNHDIAELARKIGVTPVTLYRWLSAKFDPGVARLASLAETLDVSLAWLVAGDGPMDRRRAVLHALLDAHIAIEYVSKGATGRAPIAFLEDWLFQLLYGPKNQPTTFGPTDRNPPLLFEVPDDSMEPTFRIGAFVLIDRSFGIRADTIKHAGDRVSRYDGVYLFRIDSADGADHAALVLRRVQHQLDGKIIVRCDNRNYPEERYLLGAPNRPNTIGRAVWHADRI
jgi:transcriptional regulator with XRE-family HTH domain